MESQFVVLATACREGEWLKKFLFEIELWPQLMPTISLHCDSEATMSRAFNKMYNGKSRHISLRHNYVRQLICDGIVIIQYIKTSNNLADPLIKGLTKDLVVKTSKGMGLKPFNFSHQ